MPRTLAEIRRLRILYRISYRELVETTGLSLSTIHCAFAARRDPLDSTVQALSAGVDKVLAKRGVPQEAAR